MKLPLLLRAQNGFNSSKNLRLFLEQVLSTASVDLTATCMGKVDLRRASTLGEDLDMVHCRTGGVQQQLNIWSIQLLWHFFEFLSH